MVMMSSGFSWLGPGRLHLYKGIAQLFDKKEMNKIHQEAHLKACILTC